MLYSWRHLNTSAINTIIQQLCSFIQLNNASSVGISDSIDFCNLIGVAVVIAQATSLFSLGLLLFFLING